MRGLTLHRALCAMWIPIFGLVLTGNALAQSSSDSISGGSISSNSALPGAMPGGAAQADFNTLINLIQQTIDPDSWLAAGGTNTVQPYPAGVYVDPRGHMKRQREATDLSVQLLGAPLSGPRHPWRTESQLRTISLARLERALLTAATEGLRPTAELSLLAGLSKIQYVKVDVANEDILIAGPAGDQALGFQLQDLAVVAALIKAQTMPLGCSIEPSNEGILAAQQMLSKPGAVERLARNPAMVVEQMQDKIGPHRVRVFGMHASTGTAIALIDADEHMKRVGFGTVATRQRINSYFDYLDQQTSVPKQSLIRWWFAYADQPVLSNSRGDMFQLPQQCVAVLSEQQWVSQQGRAPTGGQDPAADAFAAGMTEHLDSLRKTHPSYSRLCSVFETSLALQLAIEATGQPSLRAWFPNLCELGRTPPSEVREPKTVEGLTTSHRLKNGTVVAVVSGGVKIDARSIAARERWNESKFLAASVVPEQAAVPSSAHGAWWWD